MKPGGGGVNGTNDLGILRENDPVRPGGCKWYE